MANKWEYKVMPLSKNDLASFQDKLREAGEDGWELISIIVSPSLRSSLTIETDYFAIFKKLQA